MKRLTLLTRNYLLMFFDTVLFINAMTFISINSVIPYFLNNLGASTIMISLASAIPSIGSFATQPIFSKMVLKTGFKLRIFEKILFLQRFILFVFVICIPFIASRAPALLAVGFLVFWGFFNLFVGSYSPFYSALLRKLIPVEQRGRLAGFSGAFGNFIAIASSVLVGWLLSKVPYPYNYTVIFAIGVIILFLDVLDFHLMKEVEADTTIETHSGYLQYFKMIPEVMKENRKFFVMVIGYSFFVITNISLSYYSLYAIRIFHAGAPEIAVFTGITVAGNIVAYVIFGFVADKLGYQHVLRAAALCGAVGCLAVLLLRGIFPAYVAFALSTICATGFNLTCNIFIIQETPKEKMPIYISVNIMITLVVSSVITILCAFVIDHFSFAPVFVLTTAAALGAFLVFMNIERIKPAGNNHSLKD